MNLQTWAALDLFYVCPDFFRREQGVWVGVLQMNHCMLNTIFRPQGGNNRPAASTYIHSSHEQEIGSCLFIRSS